MENLRIEEIMQELYKTDNSFKDNEHFLELLLNPFGKKYTKEDMRETWFLGIRHGIEIGMNEASIKGQKIQVYGNVEDKKQKEFLDKFYQLANEYNCSIQYHPKHGMIVVDNDKI